LFVLVVLMGLRCFCNSVLFFLYETSVFLKCFEFGQILCEIVFNLIRSVISSTFTYMGFNSKCSGSGGYARFTDGKGKNWFFH
jgi:hypothetical protein